MRHLRKLCVLTLILSMVYSLHAQKGYEFPDSISYKKNVIKWNLTPFFLWSKKDINIGYERILSPFHSVSVNAGYFEIPQFTENLFDTLQIKNTSNRGGFTVSSDYRMYFKKRNRNMAPDGLYWGPYGSFHHTQFNNTITVIDNPEIQGDLLFGAKMNIMSAGVQLGYQFVVKERLAIDLIFMGPSVSLYNYQLTLGGDVTVDQENDYLQAIYDILKGSIPGLDQLVQDGEITASGANYSLGFGLRYMIQIGYRF